jgi:hypothetical protein
MLLGHIAIALLGFSIMKTFSRHKCSKPTASPKCHQIYCDEHGWANSVVVCRHLCDEFGLEYSQREATGDSPFEQAICKKCIAKVNEEGGWSEEAKKFGELRIICKAHFEERKKRHLRIDWPE